MNKLNIYRCKLLIAKIVFFLNDKTFFYLIHRLLIGPNYTEIRYKADGSTVITSPKLEVSLLFF